MDALEMQFKLQQKLQNHISMDLDIRTIDVEYYLNRGQDLWVDKIYDNFKGQEELLRRLEGIIVTNTSSAGSTGTGVHGGQLWLIPSNARYVIDESINTHTIPVKPVDNTYYNLNKTNSFKKPHSKVIWRVVAGSKLHELIGYTGLTVSNYTVVYIKNPTEISILNTPNVNCEIGAEWHEEIIDEAVKFAMESYSIAGSLRVKTN